MFSYQKLITDRQRKGTVEDAKETPWTFSGSFLFSLTVITTIGEQSAQMRMKIAAFLVAAYGKTANWPLDNERVSAHCMHDLHRRALTSLSLRGSIIHSTQADSAFYWILDTRERLGYGNIAPATDLGKIATIFYAIIGMPLFLLYLSNIGECVDEAGWWVWKALNSKIPLFSLLSGDILAKSFKWIYAKCFLCRICPNIARRRLAREKHKEKLRQSNGEDLVRRKSFIYSCDEIFINIFLRHRRSSFSFFAFRFSRSHTCHAAPEIWKTFVQMPKILFPLDTSSASQKMICRVARTFEREILSENVENDLIRRRFPVQLHPPTAAWYWMFARSRSPEKWEKISI